METGVVAFALYGLVSQALLVGFFAARRWAPQLAGRLGLAAYAFGALGLLIGIGLGVTGQPYQLFTGPLLLAAWAALGAAVDLWRPRPWREHPIEWRVMAPYVALYFFAQMFLWWPLWNVARVAWLGFGVLFVVNTALNLRGHAEAVAR
jgi:hypothetical protein